MGTVGCKKCGKESVVSSSQDGISGPPPLAAPKSIRPWTLTTLREKLIKIGAKVSSPRHK